jgi:cell division protein FtsA
MPATSNLSIFSRTGLVMGLDVGSAKLACLIAEVKPNALRIIGSAIRRSDGISRGKIIDLAEAEAAIRTVVAEAEQKADAQLTQVHISVNCSSPAYRTAQATLDTGGSLVEEHQLNSLVRDAYRRLDRDRYAVVQKFVTSYALDESTGVTRPLGMHCEQLSVAVAGIGLLKAPLANLQLAVEQSGLTVGRCVFGGYASAIGSTTEEERDVGVTVVDLGGAMASICAFSRKRVSQVSLVPFGGADITLDLAKLLGLQFDIAERVKVISEAAKINTADGSRLKTLHRALSAQGTSSNTSDQLVDDIIHARLEEIFSQVKTTLVAGGPLAHQIVLVGGGCKLLHAVELAQTVFGVPIKIGRLQPVDGLPVNAGPEYAAVLGLIIDSARTPIDTIANHLRGDQFSIWSKVVASFSR